MGILSDILSGKVARQNKLIGGNIQRVTTAFSPFPPDSPLRKYVFANLAAVGGFMTTIIFDTPDASFNPFRKHQRKMTREQAQQFFLLMTARYLVIFLQNRANVEWVETRCGAMNSFVKQVLTLCGGGEELFADLSGFFEHVRQENPTAWYIRVYRHAQHVALGVPFEETPDPVAAEFFTKLSSVWYETLIKVLSESLVDQIGEFS